MVRLGRSSIHKCEDFHLSLLASTPAHSPGTGYPACRFHLSPSHWQQRLRAQNPNGSLAATVLGWGRLALASQPGQTLQRRQEGKHACFDGVSRSRRHRGSRATVRICAKYSPWVTHEVFPLLCQPGGHDWRTELNSTNWEQRLINWLHQVGD